MCFFREGKRQSQNKEEDEIAGSMCVRENWFLKFIKSLLNSIHWTNEWACNLLFCKCLILWHKNLMNRRSINCLLTCLSFNYGSVVLSFCKRFTCSCFMFCIRYMSAWVIAWLNNMATKQFIRAASYSHNRARHRYLFICYWMTDWPVRTPPPPPPPPLPSSSMSLSNHTQFKWKQKYLMYVCM